MDEEEQVGPEGTEGKETSDPEEEGLFSRRNLSVLAGALLLVLILVYTGLAGDVRDRFIVIYLKEDLNRAAAFLRTLSPADGQEFLEADLPDLNPFKMYLLEKFRPEGIQGELAEFWSLLKEKVDHSLEHMEISKSHLRLLQTYRSLGDGMPDPPPDWPGYRRRLTEAIHYLEAWREPIIELKIAVDLKERLRTVRSILRSDGRLGGDDPEVALVGKIYLAETVVASVLEMEANPSTGAVLTALLPEVEDFKTNDLPFRMILSRLDEISQDPVDYNSLRESARKGLERVTREAAERSLMVRRVLGEIVEGMTRARQRRLLDALHRALARNYLFNLAKGAYPEDLQPLPVMLERELAREDLSPPRFIRILARGPVYGKELERILYLTHKKAYQYEKISIFREILDWMDPRDAGNDVPPEKVDILRRRIERLRPPDRPHLRRYRNWFDEQAYDLTWIGPLLERYNFSRNPYDRSRIRKRFVEYFRAMCRNVPRPHTGDCLRTYRSSARTMNHRLTRAATSSPNAGGGQSRTYASYRRSSKSHDGL